MWRQSPWPLSLHPISLPSLESSGLQWARLGWGQCTTNELRQSECALSVFVCFCCLLILLIFMFFGFFFTRLLSFCCVFGLCEMNLPVRTIHKSESLLAYLNIVSFLMYYHFRLICHSFPQLNRLQNSLDWPIFPLMCYHVVSCYAILPAVCFSVSILTMKCHTLVILVLILRHDILPI